MSKNLTIVSAIGALCFLMSQTPLAALLPGCREEAESIGKSVPSHQAPPFIQALDSQPLKYFSEFHFVVLKEFLSQAASGTLIKNKNGSLVKHFEEALNRRDPEVLAEIKELIENEIPLKEALSKRLRDAVFKEYRAARHLEAQSEKVYGGPDFNSEIWKHLSTPSSARDYIWLALGYSAGEQPGQVNSPTYLQLAKNVRRLHEELNTPPDLRLIFSFSYSEVDPPLFHFHALDEVLPPGNDVPIGERYLTPENFFRAIEEKFMVIDAKTHDVAHMAAWLRHPEYLRSLKELAKKHFAETENQALYFRLEWASENLVLPRPGYQGIFPDLSAGRSDKSVEEKFRELGQRLSNMSPKILKAYAEKNLIPHFEDFFETYGGGAEQFGEIESFLDPERQLHRFYEDRTPITEWTHRRRQKTTKYSGNDLTEESLIKLARELKYTLEVPQRDQKRQNYLVRDLIARMELTLLELSAVSAKDVTELFGQSQEIRQKSKLARVLKLVRGEHSTLYRVLVE